MKAKLIFLAIAAAALVAACSTTDNNGYTPPDLTSGTAGLTIGDAPLSSGGQIGGNLPGDGRHIGFVFQGLDGQVLQIVLDRTGGTAVPALAVYRFDNDTFGQALAWASADADRISLGGWQVPGNGTYLVLVDRASGDGTGTFIITLSCQSGCTDPLTCADDADCPAGMVCFDGLCFDGQVECRTDSDCQPHETCQDGFCIASCNPSPEVCDGIDNDCDGVIDEDDVCGQNPCAADSDCAAGEYCLNGLCVPLCGCATDADCPLGNICLNCQCVADDCPDADGDGYNVCRGDCDDQDAAVFPGAYEDCDNIDNDCDGIVDEGCGGLPCDADSDCAAGELCWDGMCVARCAANADCPAGQVCQNGICRLACIPESEVCDGRDNDCDGQVDEGFDLMNDPNNCGSCGMVCAAAEACANGVCSAACQADSDCPGGICDGGRCVYTCPDNDGDGYGEGYCGDCDDADPTVHPGAPEVCDGFDNDCDGQVDEGCDSYCRSDAECAVGQICYNGVCVQPCSADSDCAAGELCENGLCVADCVPMQEICDGLDNDCDGLIDEDFDFAADPQNCGGCGQVCAAGESCQEGACTGGSGCADDRECDDGDPATQDYCINGGCVHQNQCSADADCPAGMICQAGACTYDPCPDADGDGYTTCDGDCDDADASVFPGADEPCDGLDNDCDGQVDEGCEQSCAGDSDCAAGQACCAGTCADLYADPANCGGCGLGCAAGEACYDGACFAACTTDADCDDGDPATTDYCINGVCTYR